MTRTMVNKGVWVEGLLLTAISVVGVAESIRLVLYHDPGLLSDWLGPGYYLLAISLGLMITGVAYIYKNRTTPPAARQETGSEGRNRLIAAFATCALYLILIDLFGYLVATFVFFVLMFWIVGVESWIQKIVLACAMSGIFYIVFVKYCGMSFPRGIFF